MATLARAYAIAATGFQNVYDKGGRPYIEHCIEVASKMDTDDEKILGLLHDTVEDGVTTIQKLREEGFAEDILYDLDILTHKPGVPYDDYIKLVATRARTTKVKKADLEHNSNITRLKGLTKKDFDKMEKYHRSYVYLSKI